MKVQEVSFMEYQELIRADIPYDTVSFNELNSHKVDSIHFLVFEDVQPRFGLIYGVKDNCGYTPFSAPFGCFSKAGIRWDIKLLGESFNAFDEYIGRTVENFRFILPPIFYSESLLTVLQNSMFRNGYSVVFQDLDFAMNLTEIREKDYFSVIDRNARRNLKTSRSEGLQFIHCKNVTDQMEAYAVIKHNREFRGFPLRMSYDEVRATAQIIKADMYLVKNQDSINVASALVYDVVPGIAQVIYWGNEPGYEGCKPVNYIAYKLVDRYMNLGYRYLDIGPSTENGVPNYGLCDFKRKIGCKVYPKFILEKSYKR